MASIHTFMDDAGVERVYPLWVSDTRGYDIILWDDLSDGQKRWRENRARQDFEQKRLAAGLPMAATVRTEMADRRGMLVRVVVPLVACD